MTQYVNTTEKKIQRNCNDYRQVIRDSGYNKCVSCERCVCSFVLALFSTYFIYSAGGRDIKIERY